MCALVLVVLLSIDVGAVGRGNHALLNRIIDARIARVDGCMIWFVSYAASGINRARARPRCLVVSSVCLWYATQHVLE